VNTLFSAFPFIRYTIVLILGIVTQLFLQTQIPILIYLIPSISVLYAIIIYKYEGKARSILGYLGLIFIFIIGYYNASQSNKILFSDHFSKIPSFDFYQAKINTLVEDKPKTWKAVAQFEKIILGDSTILKTGNVILYFDKETNQKPEYGDLILVKGMPTLVEGPKNPFQFDYKKYLTYQSIYHQHYLRDTSFVKISSDNSVSLKGFAFKINNYCDSIFTKYITKKNELAVTNAMILGLRDDIDNDLMAAYSAAGAIHVLSVSGLHVGVIYIILVWIFGFLKKRENYGKWLFLFIILSILWLYAVVTGLSSPVLRSTFMFSLILIAETIDRQQNAYNTVAISAFCLLIYDPMLVTNVGFMLSYLAVFGMIQIQPLLNPLLVIDKRKNKLNWLADRLWKVTTVAVSAQIATLPITIYYFHQFPNYFLLANPIVILLSSIVLIGGLAFILIVAFFSFFKWFTLINYIAIGFQFIVKALNDSVLFTESLPGSISKYLNYSQFEMVILYFLILCILALVHTKKYIWVKLSVCITALLIGLSVKNYFDTKSQNIVCLHAISKATAISVIKGREAKLFGNEAFINDRKSIGFNINNFWSVSGIDNISKFEIGNESTIKIWKGKSFLFLNNKFIDNSESLKVDYLIIRHKKLRYADIKGKINFKNLIIDGSVSSFYTKRFQQEAALDGILAYSLLQSGALLL
jgi:competence protein ComEC